MFELPTFSRSTIAQIEGELFGEVPPYDGHRLNILRRQHNKVGIGLARADERYAHVCATQEFLDVYVTLDELPATAVVGDKVIVSGVVEPGDLNLRFHYIAMAHTNGPERMSIDELNSTYSYTTPQPYAVYWDERYVTDVPVKVDGQHFRAIVTLSHRAQPGLYWITIGLIDADSNSFEAVTRLILVE